MKPEVVLVELKTKTCARKVKPLRWGAVVLFGLLGHEVGAKDAGPAEVAKQFYQMANQGKCAEASGLFTAESVQVINGTLGTKDGFLRFCAGRGGRAALAELKVGMEERRGKHAQVMIERSYADGSLSSERDDLIKVDGRWKLSVGQLPSVTGRKQ